MWVKEYIIRDFFLWWCLYVSNVEMNNIFYIKIMFIYVLINRQTETKNTIINALSYAILKTNWFKLFFLSVWHCLSMKCFFFYKIIKLFVFQFYIHCSLQESGSYLLGSSGELSTPSDNFILEENNYFFICHFSFFFRSHISQKFRLRRIYFLQLISLPSLLCCTNF